MCVESGVGKPTALCSRSRRWSCLGWRRRLISCNRFYLAQKKGTRSLRSSCYKHLDTLLNTSYLF